jgi:predicted nucleic acid-binding protein
LSVFLDTSGLYALLDADDTNHSRAAKTWSLLLERDEDLVTNNYVLVESFALSQNRLGLESVRVLQQRFLPLLRTVWIDEDVHRAAVVALLTTGRRRLSLVDCASFETMRRGEIGTAFAFDRHFAEQGFALIP